MSRILLIGINYAPETIGTGKYSAELCEWLASRGHAVRVVTAPPYYPNWKIWSQHRVRCFKREKCSGVEVIRCPTWVPARQGGIARVMHLLSFALTATAAAAFSAAWRAELVVSVAPTLMSSPSAWLLARSIGAKCWLHVQDFELDAASDMGIVNFGPLRHLATALELRLLRRFDVVSTISSQMLVRLTEKGVDQQRQELFPNWVDLAEVQPASRLNRYRRALHIPADAIVALYSGSMGLKQGLEILGDTARQLSGQQHIYFVFAGEGPGRAPLERACADLPNVRFAELQPRESLGEWLATADVHLLPQRADVADLVMPSKLTGMLASGRPVLATAAEATSLAEAIQGCGVISPPGNSAAFAAALRLLADDRKLRQRLGHAARRQAEAALSRDRVLQRFEQRMNELLGAGKSTTRAL